MFWPPVGSATRSNRHCALPHLIAPQGAQEGRHRHRCALPVPLVPATPLPPREGAPSIASLLHVCGCTAPAGSLRRRRSATEDALLLGGRSATGSGAARPVTDPLQAFLPLCQASQCTAAGLLRQDPASLRAPAGRPLQSGCLQGQESVLGGLGAGGPPSRVLCMPGDRRRTRVPDAALARADGPRGDNESPVA